MMPNRTALIVSIVRKGWGTTVLEASQAAGAGGGTVVLGRGTGIHEQETIFGMSIEPEKEVVLTVVHVDQVDAVLDAIVRAAELDAAGKGLAFVVPVDRVVGVTRSMTTRSEDEGQ